MQGAEILYMVLAVAFAVPIVIMWRTRMLRLDAHIEVPPEDTPGPPASLGLSVPPNDWSVSDAIASGQTLQPVRAASLLPVRGASIRPKTISDGSGRPSLRSSEPLPMPVRRLSLDRRVAPNPEPTDARTDGLPVPLRSNPPAASDE